MAAYQDYLMQFFEYAHLKPELQKVSKPFGDFAQHLLDTLPNNPERHEALEQLLRAKDHAVRASIYKSGD